MSEHDRDPDRDFEQDPEQEARVRALLADLRDTPDAALPPDVAARLDDTLAGLVAGRAGRAEAPGESPAGAHVVPVRRRRASRAAAAAAAVIVLGAGGVAVAELGDHDGSESSTSSADAGATSKAETLQDTPQAPSPTSPPSSGSAAARALPQLTAAGFEDQVTALLDGQRGLARLQPPRNQSPPRKAPTDASGGSCAGPAEDDGSSRLVALYDGSPVALVIHPEQDGARRVEAWTCSGDRRVDSAAIPVGPAGTRGD